MFLLIDTLMVEQVLLLSRTSERQTTAFDFSNHKSRTRARRYDNTCECTFHSILLVAKFEFKVLSLTTVKVGRTFNGAWTNHSLSTAPLRAYRQIQLGSCALFQRAITLNETSTYQVAQVVGFAYRLGPMPVSSFWHVH